jgi:hypothetical protein
VRLTARLSGSRRKRLSRLIGATVAGAGLAAGGIALFTTAPLEAMSVIAGGGMAAGTLVGARSAQRREIDKAEAALERFLDRLEHERS